MGSCPVIRCPSVWLGGCCLSGKDHLLRVTVQNVPKDAASLKVTFPGKKVQGFFTLNGFTAGTDGVALDDASGDDDSDIAITNLGISAFTESLVINVPIPMGVASSQEYLYVRVGAYDSKGNKINSIDTPMKLVSSVPTAWAPGRKASRKVTAKLPYFSTNRKNYQKIVFAPGNLQATTTVLPTSAAPMGEASNWRFAAHQWEAYGDCTSNNLTELGDVDLFAWVGKTSTYDSFTDANKYGLFLVDIAFGDWTKNKICGYGSAELILNDWSAIFNGSLYPENTWRLLNNDREGGESAAEVDVLLTRRSTTSTYVAAKATILQENGTDTLARGLIVFPDTYTHPYGVKELFNYTTSNNKAGHFANNVITLAEWDILENVGGCAFLPVTCIRDRVKIDGTYVRSTGIYKEGAYWNNYSVSGSNVATTIICDAWYSDHSRDGADVTNQPKGPRTNINPTKSVDRSRGCAVRLVRNVN